MATTPSGMPIEEAEALSKQFKITLPKEGSLVRVPGGEGAEDLFVKGPGNQLFIIDPEIPTSDFGGKTIGHFKNLAAQRVFDALGGRDKVPLLNAADFFGQYGGQLERANVSKLSISELIQRQPGFETEQVAPGGAPQSNILAAAGLPDQKIAPENSIAGIKQVFGQQWNPAPAFTPAIQAKGIFGAVRIKGTNEVYTLGTKGAQHVTAQQFRDTFGTDNQKGIVGEISREQAAKLGVPGSGQTPVAPGTPGATITPGGLAPETKINISGVSTNGTDTTAINAGIQSGVDSYNASKSDREKEVEEELTGIEAEMKKLIEESGDMGADQLTAEKAEEVRIKQEATDDAYAEVEDKENEIRALEAAFNTKNQIIEGKPITLGSIQGQQAQEYKLFLAQKSEMTIEALRLQSKALALQGKTDRAQAAADKSVELKYADAKSKLERLSALYDIVRNELTEAQQPRLAALEAYNEQVKDAIAIQMAQEKAENNTKLSLISKYKIGSMDNTLEELTALSQTTATYRQETRLADGTGDVGFKFSASDFGQLSAVGLTTPDINGLQSDIQQYGLEASIGVGSGFSDEAKTVIRNIMSGRTTTQIQEEEDQQKRTWGDEEIRQYIASQSKAKVARVSVSGLLSRESTMTEADRERAALILGEMWNEGEDEVKKQWR